MVIQPIQIIAIIFILFAYSRVILRFKDKKVSINEFIMWSILWIAALVFVWIPTIINSVSNFFGISRPVDLIVYVSIVALFYLIFRLYVKIENLEQDITKMVRYSSIKKKK